MVASLTNALAALAGTTHEHVAGGAAAHRLEAEMALSRRIQRSLIPLTPPELRGFEVATYYEAAREVGGDFFDVFPLRDRAGRAGIVIADVTGKGIAAALLMAFARPLIRSAIDQARDPLVALERTNSILVQERRSALFITALAAVLDLRTHVLRVGNAGHEPPLIVPADGRPISWLTGSGPLIGAFPSLDLVPCELTLAPGDLVLLYTDGVTDTRAASGERFGDERLIAVVEGARDGSARDIVDAVVAATSAFQGDMPAADDVTMVALRRATSSATARRGQRRRREAEGLGFCPFAAQTMSHLVDEGVSRAYPGPTGARTPDDSCWGTRHDIRSSIPGGDLRARPHGVRHERRAVAVCDRPGDQRAERHDPIGRRKPGCDRRSAEPQPATDPEPPDGHASEAPAIRRHRSPRG